MKLLYSKKTILPFLAVCFLSVCAKAQVGYDFSTFDIGVNGAINQVYGDAESIKSTPSINFNINYNQTPFVNYIVEAQFGRFEGGSVNSISGRYFKMSFSAVHFRAQLQAGELIDYSTSPIMNALKNFYISAGIGMVYTTKLDINRTSNVIPGFYTGGNDSANEAYMPLRIGYEFKFFNQLSEPSVKIDIAYQYNHVFGDDLDGFVSGNKGDNFSQISIGVKFPLGGVTSYRKQIYY